MKKGLWGLFFIMVIISPRVMSAQSTDEKFKCEKPAVQYWKDAQRYTKEAENLKDSDGMVPKEAIKKSDLRVAALLSLQWFQLCWQQERGGLR